MPIPLIPIFPGYEDASSFLALAETLLYLALARKSHYTRSYRRAQKNSSEICKDTSMLDKVEAYLERLRPKYAALPRHQRLLITTISFIGIALGILLLLPLPELGIPLALVNLGVLSFEYSWAERARKLLLTCLRNRKVRNALVIIGVLFMIVVGVYFCAKYTNWFS
jgi:hypothetical protein